MASLFDSLGLKCEECGENGDDSTQGYKVVEQKHLCQTCARRLAQAILSDVAMAAVKWPCPNHEKKEVEVYCRKCQAAMCHTCALTAHSGHEMEDIMKFFAKKKGSIKKDVDEISSRQSETRSFLEEMSKCSEEVEKHFGAIQNEILSSFEAKANYLNEERRAEISKIERDAEEEIRKIEEKRDAEIKKINNRTDDVKSNLERRHNAVSSELREIMSIISQKTARATSSAEDCMEKLESAETATKSLLVDCDSKAFQEQIEKLNKINFEEIPSPPKDLAERLSDIALKVTFKRVQHKERVGYLSGKQTTFEMAKTIQVPSEIQEPFLVGLMNEKKIAIRNGIGSALYAIDIETGLMDVLLEPDAKRGIWDVTFLDEKRLAYSDYNSGTLQICDMNGECERSLMLPKDGSRFAFLNTDTRGQLLAANHVEGEIYFIDSTTGLVLRTLNDIECKPIMEFGTLQNGDIIVRSGYTEVYHLFRSSGATKTKTSLADWSKRPSIHVGPDNMIYAISRSTSGSEYTGRVSILSPDGVTRRENFIEFPTSCLYRYRPRCIVPCPGIVVILNGCVLLVYKETPGIDELLNSS